MGCWTQVLAQSSGCVRRQLLTLLLWLSPLFSSPILGPWDQSVCLFGSRVLLWGPAAVEHHKTCRSLGKSLWQQPSVADILCLLDRDRMLQTILHFPQNRRLLPSEVRRRLPCPLLPRHVCSWGLDVLFPFYEVEFQPHAEVQSVPCPSPQLQPLL